MNSSEDTKLNVLRDTLLSLRESDTIGVMFFHNVHDKCTEASVREKKTTRVITKKYVRLCGCNGERSCVSPYRFVVNSQNKARLRTLQQSQTSLK